MKQAKLLFLLIAALAFASCRPTARQAVVDAEQPTDSTEAVTSADTLRLVIADKSLSRIDSVVQARIINPNDYDVSYGQEYAIERETDGHWQQVPFPKNFGFASVLSTVAATHRRQNPLRRLLHQERRQVPNRDISVGIRLTF